MALGAEAGDVARLVGGRVAPILVTGFAAGGLLSWLASAWTGSLLYGVKLFDPESTGVALMVLAGVGLIAAAVPVWRAR